MLIGAANSLVSENNPETIDNVRKSIKIRPFLRISENFRKENKETNQTKKTTKNKKEKKKNKDLATSLPKAICGQIFGVFGFLFFFFFFLFFCFLLFFCLFLFFCGFAGCLGFNPLCCVGSLC